MESREPFSDLAPIHDDFSKTRDEFNGIIAEQKSDKLRGESYIYGTQHRFFDEVSLHDAIVNPRHALRIVLDLGDRKDRRANQYYDFYIELLSSRFRHMMADQFFYLDYQEKKAIRANSILDAEEKMSELLATCIINHALVRFYLLTHPDSLEHIFKLLNEDHIKAIEKYCPVFSRGNENLNNNSINLTSSP